MFWMFESKEAADWKHTASLEARIHNTAATKRSQLKQVNEMLPSHVREILAEKGGQSPRRGPGERVSRNQMKAAILGSKRYKESEAGTAIKKDNRKGRRKVHSTPTKNDSPNTRGSMR